MKENQKLLRHYLVYKQWRKYFRRRDSKAGTFLEKGISVYNRNQRESCRLFTNAGQPLLYLKTLFLLLNTTSKIRKLRMVTFYIQRYTAEDFVFDKSLQSLMNKQGNIN